MARLFITPRELNLISDITKEVIKDVIGQKVYYYKVRRELSNVHDVYQESQNKVFDPPVELDALVEWQPMEQRTNNFGSELYSSVTVNIHQRDILDKNVAVKEGDFFSYGSTFYEIASIIPISKIFGQIEHTTGLKIVGKQARDGIIHKLPIGPTLEVFTEPDAVQNTFAQQRGFATNENGATNDVRALRQNGVLADPITGPKEVVEDGISSSFYGDE